MPEIVNRVANSSLITIDLETLYPDGKRIQIDMKQWLEEEVILREKDFRKRLKTHDWNNYQGAYVALFCSADAILPAWATMLTTCYLVPFAKKVIVGDLTQLELTIFYELIEHMDVSEYQDRAIMIKGCSEKTIPENAYIHLITRLQSVAKSLFYGEACASVPLWKR